MATKPKSSTPYRHKTKGQYPQIFDWFGLVPDEVARSQSAWERKRHLANMYDAGLTYAEIGRRCGIGTETARVKVIVFKRHLEAAKRWERPASPVEKYFNAPGEEHTRRIRFEITVRTGEKHDCPQNDQNRSDDRRDRNAALNVDAFYFGDA